MRSPERIVLLHYEQRRRRKKYICLRKKHADFFIRHSRNVYEKVARGERNVLAMRNSETAKFWNLSNYFNKRNFQLARKVSCLMNGPTVTRFERL